MKIEDFVEASAYLRVLEKKLLTNSGIIRISEVASASEALRQISQNSEYDFSSITRIEDYEKVLKAGLKNTYDLLYRLSPHRAVIDVPAAKYDFHNLKVALKAKYTRTNLSDLYSRITDLSSDDIEAYILNGEVREALPEYIKNAADEADAAFLESKDPQQFDIVVDKHMYKRVFELCSDINSDLISEYIKLEVDFLNIKTLMRVKNMRKGTRFLDECLISGGLTDRVFFLTNYEKSPDNISTAFYYKYFGDMVKKGIDVYNKMGNYSGLEKAFDNYLIEYTKKAKYIAFGPEILFAYVLSKENEARQIRILVTCKNNNMRVDTLRERLRENYA